MLTLADKGGWEGHPIADIHWQGGELGVKNGLKYADIIRAWSLSGKSEFLYQGAQTKIKFLEPRERVQNYSATANGWALGVGAETFKFTFELHNCWEMNLPSYKRYKIVINYTLINKKPSEND